MAGARYNTREAVIQQSSLPKLKDLVVTSYDKASLQHTRLSVPAQLTVRPSLLPGASLGVFATTAISKDVRMGPYEGKKVSVEEAGKFYNTAYAWEVRLKGTQSFYIDGQDPTHSNWMRYVNCARSKDEQNTSAYQHGNKIYYRTVRDIDPDSELLVLYDEDYATDLLGGTSQKLEELLYKQGKSYEHTLKDVILYEHGHSVGIIPNEQVIHHFKGVLDKDSVIISGSQIGRVLDDGAGMRSAELASDSSDESSSSSDLDEGGLLKCSRCQEEFGSEKYLREHDCECMSDVSQGNGTDSSEIQQATKETTPDVSKSSEGTSSLECEKCGEVFLSLSVLEGHMTYHSEGVQHKCPLCDKAFNTEEGMTKHCKMHAGGKPYVCDYCHKGFNSKSSLRMHVRTHTGERPHRCDHCDKAFSTTAGLYQHVRMHTGDKPYKCDHCGKDFRSSSNMHEHLRVHTGDKPYKCDVCEKTFGTNSTLKQHMKTHSSEKSYICDQCGKGFTHSSNLSQHRKIHSTVIERPHKCDHCEKSFHLKSHLHQHLRMHSDARPFECEHCGKKFASNSYLVFHVKSHLGEKSYKCDHCPKAFTHKVYLKQHMKIHSDVKAYTCEQCGKAFRHQSNLSQHYKVHTEVKPFQCEVCGKTFSRRQNLRQHSRTHLKKDS